MLISINVEEENYWKVFQRKDIREKILCEKSIWERNLFFIGRSERSLRAEFAEVIRF